MINKPNHFLTASNVAPQLGNYVWTCASAFHPLVPVMVGNWKLLGGELSKLEYSGYDPKYNVPRIDQSGEEIF